MEKWFVQTKGQFEGPYTRDTIEKRLRSGQLLATDLIWGRKMEHWRTLHWWQNSAEETEMEETKIAHPEVWHYAFDGNNHGPLTWNDLLFNLKTVSAKSIDQLSQIMLWTKGMKNWTSVLEFHEVLEELGVNKREHPRAAIVGTVTIKSQGLMYTAALKTLSEGGFGTDPISGLTSGQVIAAEIQSSEFPSGLNVKAEVRYSTQNVVGFKFVQLSEESSGTIIAYVKKAGRRFFLETA